MAVIMGVKEGNIFQQINMELIKNTEFQAELSKIINEQVLYKPHEHENKLTLAYPCTVCATARIDVSGPTKIGMFFMMNNLAKILRHKHPIYKGVPMMLQCLHTTIPTPELVIEDDVWLQERSIIMPNVSYVHPGTILTVGAILTKNTDRPNWIWAGAPARPVKERPEHVQAQEN